MDEILNRFLKRGWKEAITLSVESDLLRIASVPVTDPPTMHLLLFQQIEFLRRERSGEISVANNPIAVGVNFPLDYLRSSDPRLYIKIATLLDPVTLDPHPDYFHPNVDSVSGTICLGAGFRPGTPFPALIWHLYEIITYQNFSLDERNALNREACRYLRDHSEVISTLRIRPLRRRRLRASAVVQEVKGK